MGVGHEDQCKTLRAHRVSLSEKSWSPARNSPEIRGSCSIMPHMPLVVEIERVWIFSATRDRLLTKDMIYPWFVRDGSEVVVYSSKTDYLRPRPLKMPGESKETRFDEFVATREQSEKLMGALRSESARSREHGEAEYMALHHCQEGQRNQGLGTRLS